MVVDGRDPEEFGQAHLEGSVNVGLNGRYAEFAGSIVPSDVDIVLFDGVMMESEDLTIPHPRYAERRFVLAPLADIAPSRCPDGWQERLDGGGVRSVGPLSTS
jgi:hypothetical protein